LPTYAQVRANATEQQVHTLEDIADVVVDTDRCTPEDVLVRVAVTSATTAAGLNDWSTFLLAANGAARAKDISSLISRPSTRCMSVWVGRTQGHKVFLPDDRVHAFFHLPSATLHAPDAELVLGPAAVIFVPKLLKEIADALVTADRLSIDPQAMIIEEADQEFERRTLRNTIASTAQGVGAATARKVLRGEFPGGPPVRLAGDIRELTPYVRPTRHILDRAFRDGRRVFLEGTQGTGLSLHHGVYNWVTSRDTTVSGCLADAGIAPSRVRRIVMVCRTYPIRVQNPDKEGRHSGPMGRELSYEQLSARCGIPIAELRGTETTTTTGRQRRLAEFNWALLRNAATLNGPTDIALSFADYIRRENKNARRVRAAHARYNPVHRGD
jgi:adenylosuccinate synthase